MLLDFQAVKSSIFPHNMVAWLIILFLKLKNVTVTFNHQGLIHPVSLKSSWASEKSLSPVSFVQWLADPSATDGAT